MIPRLAHVLGACMLFAGSAAAQGVAPASPASAAQYVDPVTGLSLDEATTRAIAQEPSLRAARAVVDVARAMRVQAGLRPNPTLSFERREEPGGTDNQTMAGLQWPLDLFRRSGRVAVAERELESTELSVRDRERLLAADVRMAYGGALAAVRDLSILDALVEAVSKQHELFSARVAEGAAPPLERDLLTVELRRIEAERVLQIGQVEAALFELKRVVGLLPDTPLKLRDDLEGAVRRDAAIAPNPIGGDPAQHVATRPDVRAGEARVRLADAQVERAQREARFDVTLTGSYMRMDAGFTQLGFTPDGMLERVRGTFQYFTGGVMVMTPLFNRNQGQIAAARAERIGAVAELDAARVAAANELAAARARDAQAQRAVQMFSGGALALARQNLAVVTETFSVGRVTVFDVLAEQRRYLELERAYTQALGAAFEARTALRRALGDQP